MGKPRGSSRRLLDEVIPRILRGPRMRAGFRDLEEWSASAARVAGMAELENASVSSHLRLGSRCAAVAPDCGLSEDLGLRLWCKFAGLPGDVRETIFLHQYEGLSISAVSRALGLSERMIRSMLGTGRQLLGEESYRQLQESISAALPPAHGWKRRGRRLTLVALMAVSQRKRLRRGVSEARPT